MRPASPSFIAKTTGVIVATVITSQVVVLAVRCCVNLSTLSDNNDVAGNYLQTIGTVYAVLLAFVVFVVWSQHNDTRHWVQTEANEIRDLLRIVVSLSPALEPAQGLIRGYLTTVISEEWPAMAGGEACVRANRLLEEVWGTIESLEPKTSREEILYAEALARFDDLSDARAGRLLMIRQRLPASMWALLLIGGVLTTGSMALFGLPSLLVHGLMTGALGGLISFMLVIIADLDNAFAGDWRVTPLAFEEVLTDLNAA